MGNKESTNCKDTSKSEEKMPIQIYERRDDHKNSLFSCNFLKYLNLVNLSKENIQKVLEHKKSYITCYCNGKRVDIFTFPDFPCKYNSSMHDLLSNALCEPYSIFLVSSIIGQHGEICLAAEADEKCVGVMLNLMRNYDWGQEEEEQDKSGYICMIAVDEDFRGFGLGSLLLNEGMKLMKTIHGATKVYLEAVASNTAALNFYTKNGFIRIDLREDYYHNGEDAFILERSI